MDIGHPDNFCGGNFRDWLEVNLTPACNAKCSWCVENHGWHPKEHANWFKICQTIVEEGKKNVILLGGEPTLHPDLADIVEELAANDKNVYITTNGSMLTPEWVRENLNGIHGVNLSIHDCDSHKNEEITGITLDFQALRNAIYELHDMGAEVRFNCNCIQGYVDSEETIRRYIAWAHRMGADSVRFAELKHDDNSFVDLAKVFNYEYGLNDDPFNCGCNKNCEIDGMPVNFRQMCGFQTSLRPKPDNPQRVYKPVVYYDGKVYNGWQLKKESDMDQRDLERILENVENGHITAKEAQILINRMLPEEEEEGTSEDAHCVY